jgi:hypothetical protein
VLQPSRRQEFIEALREEVSRQREAPFSLKVTQLRAAACLAVDALVEALQAPKAADRIRAANVILNYCYREADLADALREVREALAEMRGERASPPGA